MPSLELIGVSKKHRNSTWELSNVSVTIDPRLFFITGPNGAGKTTMLRLLAGITRPTAGKVVFNGQDIHKEYIYYKRRLGYLPQEVGFYPDMTGREFLAYMAKLKGIPQKLYPARTDEIARDLRMQSFIDRKISGWSAGMRQRLGMAQALLSDPEVLILDEPLVGLDPEDKLYFLNYFLQLSKERIIIISSNHISNLTTITSCIAVLADGSIRFNGRTKELLRRVEGKVWVATVPVHMGLSLAKKWVISSMRFNTNECIIRIVSETMPAIPGVLKTEHGIEDAYAYIIRASATTSRGEEPAWFYR